MSHIVERDNTQAPPKHTDAHPAEVTVDSARQAPRGSRVLFILLAALSFIVVAFGVLYVIASWTTIAPGS